jgi:hypothetical protein
MAAPDAASPIGAGELHVVLHISDTRGHRNEIAISMTMPHAPVLGSSGVSVGENQQRQG